MSEDNYKGESQFPIIQLWEDILVIPIVGAIDSNRAKNLMSNLLHKTRETGAGVVIIDLSGVAVMDTEVSKYILDLANAVRLMGTRYIVCGIQPEQTQTMIDLGIDISAVETKHDLSSALSDAIGEAGMELVEKGEGTDE